MSTKGRENRLGAALIGILAVAFVVWRLAALLSAPADEPGGPAETPVATETGTTDSDPVARPATLPAAPSTSGRSSQSVARLAPLVRDPFRSYPLPKTVVETASDESGRFTLDRSAFHLQGIALGDGPELAIINGKVLARGDLLDGARVAAIEPGAVTLELAGDRIRLTMQPDRPREKPLPEGKR